MIPPAQPGRRRHVVVNASALASASIWRIAISFVLFWYIARVLGVEALGQYSLGMAYLNVAAIFSEAGLPNLLVRDLAQHPEYRRSRFRHAMTLQSILSLLTWIFLIGLVQILPLSDVVRQAIVLGAAFLPFYAVTSVSLTMCKSSERMDLVFWLEVTGTTLMFVGSIGLIMLGYGVVGLFGVQIVAQAAVAALGLVLVVRNALLSGDQIPIAPGWIMLLRRALPFNGLALSEVLLQRMDVLILGVMVSDAVMGIYAAANNLVRVLTKLVQSIWWSLYPTLSRLRRSAIERYRRLIGLTLYLGFLTLLPAVALSIIVAPELLHLVYGTDYLESAGIYRVIVCMVPLFFYEMYGITVLMVEHKPSRQPDDRSLPFGRTCCDDAPIDHGVGRVGCGLCHRTGQWCRRSDCAALSARNRPAASAKACRQAACCYLHCRTVHCVSANPLGIAIGCWHTRIRSFSMAVARHRPGRNRHGAAELARSLELRPPLPAYSKTSPLRPLGGLHSLPIRFHHIAQNSTDQSVTMICWPSLHGLQYGFDDKKRHAHEIGQQSAVNEDVQSNGGRRPED